MSKKDKRFVVKEEQSSFFGSIQVVVDTATGVNYLVIYGGGGPSGITPLLNTNGNVVVDSTAQYTLE